MHDGPSSHLAASSLADRPPSQRSLSGNASIIAPRWSIHVERHGDHGIHFSCWACHSWVTLSGLCVFFAMLMRPPGRHNSFDPLGQGVWGGEVEQALT